MKSRIALAAISGAFVLTSLSMPAFALKTAPAISKPKTQSVLAVKKTKASKKVSFKGGTKTILSCGKK